MILGIKMIRCGQHKGGGI